MSWGKGSRDNERRALIRRLTARRPSMTPALVGLAPAGANEVGAT